MVESEDPGVVIPKLKSRYLDLMGTLEVPTVSFGVEPREGRVGVEAVFPEAGVAPMSPRRGPVYVKVLGGPFLNSEIPFVPIVDSSTWLKGIAEEADPGKILSLASIGRKYAIEANKLETAVGLGQVEEETKPVVSIEELTDCFGQYNVALMGLESARIIIREAAKDANSNWGETGGGSTEERAGVLSSLKDRLSAAGNIVVSTFQRLAGYAESRVENFVETVEKLARDIGAGVRDSIVAGFRAVFQALGALLSKVISMLLGWAELVRETAKERNFNMSKFTIKIPSSSWENVTMMGFSIPIPLISTPELQFEFT
jgi:hypothetical protein